MTAPHPPAAPTGRRKFPFKGVVTGLLGIGTYPFRKAWQGTKWTGRQVAKGGRWASRNAGTLAIGAAAANPAGAVVAAKTVAGSSLLSGLIGLFVGNRLGQRKRKTPDRGTWSGPVANARAPAEASHREGSTHQAQQEHAESGHGHGGH